ncbi:twin-arginine translocase subunit TatC [Rickettsiales bacterium]|nr:twin-arginine translocase subunit TatC [Rickettsiales bacterium]
MTLQEHLSELRSRFIYITLFFIISLVICFNYSLEIYNFLLRPFIAITQNPEQYRMIFTSPGEAFFSYLKLSLIATIFISTPFFLTQIYLFIAPALYQKEKKYFIAIFISSPFLFFGGAIIAFCYILPLAFEFFLNFENKNISHNSAMALDLEIKISEYLNFCKNIIFGFGVACQLPIILILLYKMNIISLESLTNKRKYWILSFFLIAAILTPPDIISQIIMAIIMIILFELIILLLRVLGKKY